MKKWLLLSVMLFSFFASQTFAGTPCDPYTDISGCNIITGTVTDSTDLTLTNGTPSAYFFAQPIGVGSFPSSTITLVGGFPGIGNFSTPFVLSPTAWESVCTGYPCNGAVMFFAYAWSGWSYGDVATVLISYDGDGHFTTVGDSVAPFLGFPLENLTPYTATISAVFDHSIQDNDHFGCSDGTVIAYTGETGSNQYYYSDWSTSGTTCPNDTLYGFAKDNNGTHFVINGHYNAPDANGNNHFLFYDGHNGYDFPVSAGTQVNAAAGGYLYDYEWSDGTYTYNDLYIDHGNGHKTYYLHLSERQEGKIDDYVNKGEEIGHSGAYNNEEHLHFTVKKGNIRIDPYGWTGTGSDPLQIDGHNNVCLWDACS